MSDTDSESHHIQPAKRQKSDKKHTGASKYKTSFKNEWGQRYPGISGIKNDRSMFRCNVCQRNLSCDHQGEADIKRHVMSEMHERSYKAQSQQPKLNVMFAKQPDVNAKKQASGSDCKYNFS